MTELLNAAKQARLNAYTPYSQFKVGAAVKTHNGLIFAGCNIENASYGLTVCAERVAIFAALTAGCSNIVELAVVADTELPVTPCGACRQVMQEFGIQTVYMSNLNNDISKMCMQDLLPHAFNLTQK